MILPRRTRPASFALFLAIALFQGVAIHSEPLPPPTPPVARPRDWAFHALTAPSIPNPATAQPEVLQPLDAFIQSTLQTKGLTPSPPADRATLLRRASYDLLGLPPTREELRDFLQDKSPHAFEKVVERLLASPRYGERWAQHWMDVVRYADTAGDNADYPLPEAFRYRDYIIDSLNHDKPYDQFIVEQLAGDILAVHETDAARHADKVVATGFLALSRRYATAPFELMHLTLEDAIETTGRTFLGMSFRCARCHDHKSDPITQQDYYGLYGMFASTTFPYAGSEEFQSKNLPRTGFIPLLPPEQARRPIEENRRKLESLRAELEMLDKQMLQGKTNAPDRRILETNIAALRLELKRRERSGAHPDLPVAYSVSEGTPKDQPLQQKGDPATPGPIAPRCVPRIFLQNASFTIAPGSSGRRELAAWIASPQNPLTARVMANRIWQHHFGRGLVETPSDFGLSSKPPSHPELLDFLALEFIRSGWSIKAMHRMILRSATWQQASTLPVGISESSPSVAAWRRGQEIDPDNGMLWRFPRMRMDAEALRDSWLMLAGKLDLQRPGPHPFPPIEEWRWTQHNPFKAVYESNHRSVYLMRQRLQRHPFLSLFDAPDANLSSDARTSSTLPQQALYLLNNAFFDEHARWFIQQVCRQDASTAEGLRAVHECAWGREPTEQELHRANAFLTECQHRATAAGLSHAKAEQKAWESYGRVLLSANAFHYID